MPLADHLRELRRRFLLAALGIVVGAVAGWFLYPWFFAAINAPMEAIADRGQGAAINFGTVGGAFDMRIRLSLFIGLFVSSPWWVGQIFAFVSPGLTRKERRTAIGFGVAGAVLFLAGGALGWLVLPNAVTVLTAFTPDDAVNLIDARTYLSFFTRVMLVFGVAFLLPVVMVALNAAGLVSGRTFLGAWRWLVLLAFLFAAVANPLPDAWSMIAMALPICALFFGAIGIALWSDRRRARRRPA
ncbi:twin-arginine translocase subunit TatC [Georgenia sp. 311]|uniref:Sec-independent protein translocase protein TatC n=1 Tax=Georgenia wutianyii TaxID=2585135 RepID=A0ABX5VNB6_9MICO|nr:MULTISPECIES: twin-arginine translocase subunit TatC [Georgenia]QDB79698.1 twin-arginine translocase subunit TatC [Georgenia wutianyii]TNC16568.1 twin-arginine translocase subunit TatC [Georgenia sp. 311]